MVGGRKALVAAGVVLSMLCSVLNGIDMSFNVYALELKHTFNFTQSQVEVTAASGTLGMMLAIFEPICTEVLGTGLPFILIWILVTLSSASLGLAAVFNGLFRRYPVFIYLSHCFLIAGTVMGGNSSMRVVLTWFPRRHSGKLIGTIYAMFSLGKVVLGATMDFFFTENLAGFFFSYFTAIAVLYGCNFVILFMVFKMNPEETNAMDPDETKSLVPEETPFCIRDILRHWFFHMTFWPSAMSCGIMYAFLSNITTIAASVGVVYPMSTVYLVSVIIAVGRIVCGLFFDRFFSSALGLFLILLSLVVFATALLLSMFSFNTAGLYVVTALTGVSLAPMLTITITTLVKKFGRNRSNFISSSVVVPGAGLETVALLFLGYVYDKEGIRQGRHDNFCFGVTCYFLTFTVMLLLIISMLFVLSINFGITLYGELQQRKTQQATNPTKTSGTS